MIRPATIEDVPAIHALDPTRIDDLTPGPDTLETVVVLSDDCMIAYGAIKLFAELVIATNKDVSTLTRAKTIERMMGLAVKAMEKRPVKEMYTFTDDPRYAEFLKDRLGFKDVLEKPLSFSLR